MAKAVSTAPENMYIASKKIYPMAVHGRLRRIKWSILAVTLGIYYFLPFIRWDRGPHSPDQAVLIDMAARRAYFFFIEIWPQEIYYLIGLLILAAIVLFLMNAIAGRLWCGYMCPQTVWTDLFLLVERWTEGDRRERVKLDEGPWTFGKVKAKILKHFLWLMIAWWTGGAWVLYFNDAPTLVGQLLIFQAPLIAYIWIGILTFTTYSLAGFMREQVCTFMCPWPRIQAALTDEWALNVTYRTDRGEPRHSLKESLKLTEAGKTSGDCIDCYQCVAACPTGVDIREGLQLDCIQCGLCIDACDNVMEKIGRQPGLIGYDTEMNIERRRDGMQPIFRIVRPRTIIYAVLIALIGCLMLYALVTRDFSGINVIHDRNPIYVEQSDGSIRNGYTLRIANKRNIDRHFVLSIDGMPMGTRIESVGHNESINGNPVVKVGPDRTREIRILVHSPANFELSESTPVTFRLVDLTAGESSTANDYFKAPAAKNNP